MPVKAGRKGPRYATFVQQCIGAGDQLAPVAALDNAEGDADTRADSQSDALRSGTVCARRR
jgi:hypothetical protein